MSQIPNAQQGVDQPRLGTPAAPAATGSSQPAAEASGSGTGHVQPAGGSQPVQPVQRQPGADVQIQAPAIDPQANAQPPPVPQAGQAQPQGPAAMVGLQAMEDLRREVVGMRDTLGRLQQGRNVDVLRDELVQYAGRPQEVFDPRTALALMENLVVQARREGHPKLQEFLVILETTSPHAGEYYFKGLIIDQFGLGVVKKVTTGVDTYVKLQNKVHGPGGGRAGNRDRRPSPISRPSPRRGRGGGRGGGGRGAQPWDECYRCHGNGHWARDCKMPRK